MLITRTSLSGAADTFPWPGTTKAITVTNRTRPTLGAMHFSFFITFSVVLFLNLLIPIPRNPRPHGFVPIAGYYDNPHEGVLFIELALLPLPHS